ncbi:large conductance mechanosensitive channel protein MscL [Gordonia sp. X0973]|uniref:large conductance mechanosensitive channel protein MscL n=1 Tax=Gordonia sp. X0973 TaxID=2742602 RepID=UPI000F543BC5|nr:large conductance mechanosensitive channel protein MscL [Gordonia sp. X0973]QKT09040.1 large conductance mechanosensitive channel protein MscL [Gordonia sp. X0973]
MLKGFKEFILRGNVVELATAVIIGAAFTAIVTAFTDKVIQPLINAIPGGTNPDAIKGLGFCVGECHLAKGSTDTTKALNYIDLTAVITAAINFLIVAAVVYFIIVLPYNKLSAMMVGSKAEDTEISLLTEIRNLMDPEAAKKAEAEPEPATMAYSNREIPPPPIGVGPGPGAIPPAGEPMIRPAGGYPTGSQPPVGGGYPTGSQPPVGYNPPPQSYPTNAPGGYPGETNYPGDYPPDHPGRHSR